MIALQVYLTRMEKTKIKQIMSEFKVSLKFKYKAFLKSTIRKSNLQHIFLNSKLIGKLGNQKWVVLYSRIL